jgi:ATP-dependent RNA helicase DDX3X
MDSNIYYPPAQRGDGQFSSHHDPSILQAQPAGRGFGGRGRGGRGDHGGDRYQNGDTRHSNQYQSNNFHQGGYQANGTRFNGTGYGGGRGGYQQQQQGHQQAQFGYGAPHRGDEAPCTSHVVEDSDVEKLFTEAMNTGINFDKYEDIPVEITPHYENVQPIDAFDKIPNIHPTLVNNIRRAQYSKPTPVQKYAIPIGISQRDLMACAQTGSGKTAAFLFPIINVLLRQGPPPRPQYGPIYPSVLILAPTRELATQIYDETRKFTFQTPLRPVVIYGGADIKSQFSQLKYGCDILVATPGRLGDMMERGRIGLGQIQFLVLDEADRMLDMGFEPKIREIVQQSDMPPPGRRQTMMFSATFPKPIQQLASEFLNNYIFLTVGRVGSTTECITQKFEWVEDGDKREYLRNFLLTLQTSVRGEKSLALVFVETKRDCDSIDYYLRQCGISSTCIHGDRQQYERESALRSFKHGHCSVLVATDVASRGLDIPNVAHVIQFDLPNCIDDYVHRIGRTGRAGNVGTAIAYFNEKNKGMAKEIIDLLFETNQEVPQWLNAMYTRKPQHQQGGGRGRGRGRGGFGGKDFRLGRGGFGNRGGAGGNGFNNGFAGGRGNFQGGRGFGQRDTNNYGHNAHNALAQLNAFGSWGSALPQSLWTNNTAATHENSFGANPHNYQR